MDQAVESRRPEEPAPSTRRESLPLVSVCIPTYNDGPFLRQSLESIVSQTYPHLEILIGDDGSTDGTAEIVRSFADPRIGYERNGTNRGLYENVNLVVQRARGPYIAIYHSDDVYEPTIIEKEVAFLEVHAEAGAVFSLNRRMDNSGRVFAPTQLPPGVSGRTCLGLPEVIRVLLRHKNRLFCCPSFMGRAEVFRTLGLFNTRDYDIAADLEMWLRILSAYQVAVLDEPLMCYRKGTTQASTSYNDLRTFEEHFFHVMDHYLTRPDLAAVADPVSLTEYAFHRSDDETFRAANLVIKGDSDGARVLLRRRFPWRTFLNGVRRRKVRVVLLRWLIRAGLALGAPRGLGELLFRIEYGVRRYS